MLIGLGSSDAPPIGALEETLLDQVGLVKIFERAVVFSHRCSDSFDSSWTTLIVLDKGAQDFSVDFIETQLVDFE